MVRNVVQDAGYTAVGLAVMAAQQVYIGRREARAKLVSVIDQVKATVRPVTAPLDRMPALPGPAGSVLAAIRSRLPLPH